MSNPKDEKPTYEVEARSAVHEIVMVSDAVEASGKFGEGARELLEQSGLWDTVSDWFQQHGGTAVTAAGITASVTVPILHVLTPVLAFLLYRKAKKKQAKSAADQAALEIESRANIAEIKLCLEALSSSTQKEDAKRTREKIDELVRLTPKKGDFDALWKHFDGLLQLTHSQLSSIERRIAATSDPDAFLASLKTELQRIETAIEKNEENAVVRFEKLMVVLQDQSDMLTRLLANKEQHHSQITEQEAKISEILSEIKGSRKSGDVCEGILDQGLILIAENKLSAARKLYESVVNPLDEAFVRAHIGLGDIAMREFKYANAQAYYGVANALKIDDVNILWKLLDSMYYGGNLDEAVVNAERIRHIVGYDLKGPREIASASYLATIYWAIGRHDDAIKLNEQVLAANLALNGERHSDTLTSINNLAVYYGAIGRHADALKLKVEAIAAHKELLGERDPDTLTCMSNLASTYCAMERHSEALKLFQEVYSMRNEVFGAQHPSTLLSLWWIAYVQQMQGQLEGAIPLYTRALEGFEAVLGENHPDSNMVRESLRVCRETMNPLN